MEIRKGVIHITVNLNQIAGTVKNDGFQCLSQRIHTEKLFIHKPSLSLAIPSEFSPRLIQIKENFISNKAADKKTSVKNSSLGLCNEKNGIRKQLDNEFKRNLKTEASESTENLRYYANICSLPDNLDEISSKISNHSRKLSCKSNKSSLKSRKPIAVITNLRQRR
jgi:hypothetical protein